MFHMPIDVSGFVNQPNNWAGLYHISDRLEKRQLAQQQLALQQQNKRNAAGTFLQNYLDPKDYLSGTAYDPMVLQGLQEAMQQGTHLASSGADSPTLMMALGPMVNKLTTYSTNAKNINKQVDDEISKMKESGLIGYDFSKLKDEAMKSAFFKTDEKTGQSILNPDGADPTASSYVQKAIQTVPEKVTNSTGFDTFADKAKMKTLADDVADYDKFGNMTKNKYDLTFQEYMVPERDKKGKVSGFVPAHDVATEKGNPLFHTTIDEKGNAIKNPVRLLDEKIFDGLPPGLIDNIKGQVKGHLKEFESATGEKVSMNSSRAKDVARALAYEELNRPQRNSGSIKHAGVYDKPGPAMATLNVNMTPQAIQNKADNAAATATARTNIKDEQKLNPIDAFGRAMNGDPEVLQGERIDKNGKKVYDITGVFKGGGLQAGRGVNYHFKGIYVDPDSKSVMVDKQSKDKSGNLVTTTEDIPEGKFGQFMYRIAQSNGVDYPKVKQMLEKMGYKNNKFSRGPQDISPAADFEGRKKSWKDSFKASADIIKNPFGGNK